MTLPARFPDDPMRSALIAFVLLSLAACKTTPAALPSASVEIPTASPAPTAIASVEPDPASPSIAQAGMLAIEPKIPPFEMGMMDHANVLGWTRDGKFGFCETNGGSGSTHCHFKSPAGAALDFDDQGPNDEPNAKKHAALEARVKELDVSSAPVAWPYGSEIEITWTAIPGSQEKDPPIPGVLKVGGRVKGEAASYPIQLSQKDGSGYHDRIHVETIAISRDGKTLGVVAHAFAGEFSDAFPMALMSTAELAGHAFNDAGYARHKKGEYARAAELFAKATLANPDAKLPRYNLACAYARLGDPRAKEALTRAIEQSPDAKKKAMTDPDFESVRSEPWFKELVR